MFIKFGVIHLLKKIDNQLKMCPLENSVYALYDCLNCIFLGGVILELDVNQLHRVLPMIMCLLVKERQCWVEITHVI